jgi:hypothetical protein
MILITALYAAPATCTPRDKQIRFSNKKQEKVVEPLKCPRFEFKYHQVNDSSQSNQGTDHLVSDIVHKLIVEIRNRKVEQASTLIAFTNK